MSKVFPFILKEAGNSSKVKYMTKLRDNKPTIKSQDKATLGSKLLFPNPK